jgi:hypothetical protein
MAEERRGNSGARRVRSQETSAATRVDQERGLPPRDGHRRTLCTGQEAEGWDERQRFRAHSSRTSKQEESE